jgi:signal transduction histidine kinase
MKKHSLLKHILIFAAAQVAWLLLLGIWIYWYVSNYIIFEKVGDQLSPQILYEGINVFAFVGGIVLLVSISFGMSLTFRHLNVQLKLTSLYDNFIGNITHELKSPLSSIQLLLETLRTRKVPVEKQNEFLDLMINDANRLKNLINSILEISALEQKRVAHNYHIYEVDSMIRRIVNESIEQFQLEEKMVDISGNCSTNCVADFNALKIVFNNLFDNAIKYSKSTPYIKINIAETAANIVIEFSDNGIGISPKDQKVIFKKFHRIYDKDIPNVKGTGLGLYWVREIVKSHGGNIFVISEGKDKGTTFRIELPIFQSSKSRHINKLLKITSKAQKKTEDYDEE